MTLQEYMDSLPYRSWTSLGRTMTLERQSREVKETVEVAAEA